MECGQFGAGALCAYKTMHGYQTTQQSPRPLFHPYHPPKPQRAPPDCLQTILFVPRNTIEDHRNGLPLKTTAPSTSSCKYGLDVHSTFRLPGQSIGSVSDGSLPGGSSRGSSFPPRIIAPIHVERLEPSFRTIHLSGQPCQYPVLIRSIPC